MKLQHNIGDQMYVHSSFYISRGEDDVVGGLATVSKFDISDKLPEGHINKVFVIFKELPGHSYNYNMLLEEQEELRAEFGEKSAYPDPDINTPWIEAGDTVNGKVYKGEPIW